MEVSKPGLNKRVFAVLIDLLLLNLILLLLGPGVPKSQMLWSGFWLLKDIAVVSPGKLCAQLGIIGPDNRSADFWRRLVRNIPLAIPFIPIVEYVVLRMSPQGLRWGDHLAQTRVIDLNPSKEDGAYLWYSIGLYVVIGVIMFLTRPWEQGADVIPQ